MADDPERFAALRAEASQPHPVRLRSGLIFERAVTEWMIGAVTEGIAKNSLVNPLTV